MCFDDVTNMELKVQVDGIHRVVCGVTADSTCHDVVLALAHAIGKTGRFTLVEKWRDNERPLLPKECPIQLLQKWGEYAHEVQFLLMIPDQVKSESNKQRLKENENPRDNFVHKFSPPQVKDNNVKRSLTFSGAHKTEFSSLKNGPTALGQLGKVQSFDENPKSNSRPPLHTQNQSAQPHISSSAQQFNHNSHHNVSAFDNPRRQNQHHSNQSIIQGQHHNHENHQVSNVSGVHHSLRTTHNKDHSNSHTRNDGFQNHNSRLPLPSDNPNNIPGRRVSPRERGYSPANHYSVPDSGVKSSNHRHETSNTQSQHRTEHNRIVSPQNRTATASPGQPTLPGSPSNSILPIVQGRTRPSAFSPVIPHKHKHHNTVDVTQTNPTNHPNMKTGKVPGFNGVPSGVVLEEYDLDSNFPDILRNSRKDVVIEEYKMPEDGRGSVTRKVEPDPQFTKMQRLVNMQQERIKMQESQLQLIDTGNKINGILWIIAKNMQGLI